jgi:DNA (cytosine-5)-methyltransferase 1
MADTNDTRPQGRQDTGRTRESRARRNEFLERCADGARGRIWPTEPAVGRVANGVPNRVDRLKGLGNAVVPQIPEMIGYAILATYDKKEPD